MRGTAAAFCFFLSSFGITPACAGNSPPILSVYMIGKDHPRVCGEQSSTPRRMASCKGSPPRVRGTDARPVTGLGDAGITPACAGNRGRWRQSCSWCWDHPRVCGEQQLANKLNKRGTGSPPRVRGTVEQNTLTGTSKRITPACAGNRSCPTVILALYRDHPRVCGEQLFLARRRTLPPGSPPRVRGTVIGVSAAVVTARITPACAGNRREMPVAEIGEEDHPRVCGEQ